MAHPTRCAHWCVFRRVTVKRLGRQDSIRKLSRRYTLPRGAAGKVGGGTGAHPTRRPNPQLRHRLPDAVQRQRQQDRSCRKGQAPAWAGNKLSENKVCQSHRSRLAAGQATTSVYSSSCVIIASVSSSEAEDTVIRSLGSGSDALGDTGVPSGPETLGLWCGRRLGAVQTKWKIGGNHSFNVVLVVDVRWNCSKQAQKALYSAVKSLLFRV